MRTPAEGGCVDWFKRDLRVGLRHLARERAFSLTAGLTLALCIGANVALFAVVYQVLLRPLPAREPERLVLMSNVYPRAGAPDSSNSGVPDYYDRQRHVPALEAHALFNQSSVSMDQGGLPARVRVANVTPSFFPLLGVAPRLGRTFTEDEGQPGREFKVVLGESLWRSTFAADPAIVGRDVRLDGRPYVVVGVMPRALEAFDPGVMLWRPLAPTPEDKSDSRRHSNNYWNLGRLAPGASLQQVQAQVDALNAANLERFPQYKELLMNAGFRTEVHGFHEHLLRHVKPRLVLLWAGALFVLLIGCVNVANLALVRARGRLKELATRLALGAARSELARQLTLESLLLTLGAALGGLALGALALQAASVLELGDLPHGTEIGLGGVSVLYALALALLIGAAMGLAPALGALPADLMSTLREEGRASSASRAARSLRRGLVVAQVAFTFVLLVGAGLLFASFRHALRVDPGFRSQGVLSATVVLPATRYPDAEARRRFTDEALRRLRALPGVGAAGVTDTIPFGGSHSDSVILAEGHQMQPGESVISPTAAHASPGYFESLGVTLMRGRFFSDGDRPDSLPVLIVDENLARRFWPGRDPIGRRMYLPADVNDLLATNEKTVYWTVVGVIGNLKLRTLTEGDASVGAYYFPIAQDASSGLTFTLKTDGQPETLAGPLRQLVAGLDPELPVFDLQTMEARTAGALAAQRAPAQLGLAFGGLALLLSAVGIYGVLAYLVTQRSKEIGIRIALGSSARGIFQLVLREGLLLIGGGCVLGALGALALRRSLDDLLFGVQAGDPMVLLGMTALLAGVALSACVLPARRATRIDPLTVLAE